jgi:hypothetical protein
MIATLVMKLTVLTVYDCDGKKLWQVGDSSKGASAGADIPAQAYDIDLDPSNGTEIAVGGSDVTVYHQDGKLMWRNDKPVEPQNITIGNFLPDQPGPEIGGAG